MELSTLFARNLIHGNYFPVSVHLRVVPLAVAMAPASEMGRIATFHLAAVPLSKNVARLIGFGVKNHFAVLESYVHRFALVARATRNRAARFMVGESIRSEVNAVDVPSLALPFGNKDVLGGVGSAVHLPSIVVHGAPSTAKAKLVAVIDGAGKARLKAQGSLGAFARRRVFDGWIAKLSKAMVMGDAQAAPFTKARALINGARQSGFYVFHAARLASLNILSTVHYY